MIKFRGDIDGHPRIGLGISEENVRLLRAGRPIVVKLAELGIPGDIDVMIFYGRDENEMTRALNHIGAITEETIVHIYPRLKEPHDA